MAPTIHRSPHPPFTMINKPNKNNRRGRPGYWQGVWKRHREAMEQNLARINQKRVALVQERMALVKALYPQLPVGPLTSTELRDSLREAWNSTYGDSLDSKAAWNLIRACRRNGLFKPAEDGTYTLGQDGA